MSFTLNVYSLKERMLTPAAWQVAILDAKFPVKLDPQFDPLTHTGFLPCTYEGERTGFEYFPRELTAAEAGELEVPGMNMAVRFVVSSRAREFETALAAAGALCAATAGLLYDPQSGTTVSAESAIDWARRELRANQ